MGFGRRRKLPLRPKRQILHILFRMCFPISQSNTVASPHRSVVPLNTAVIEKNLYSRLPEWESGGCKGSRSDMMTDIPKGYLPLYVGKDMERFVIGVQFLNHPSFAKLLQMATEEYGYEQRGGLKIPCDVMVFQQIVDRLCNCSQILKSIYAFLTW